MRVYYAIHREDNWARYFISADDRDHWVELDPGNREGIESGHYLARQVRKSRPFIEWIRFQKARADVRAELAGRG